MRTIALVIVSIFCTLSLCLTSPAYGQNEHPAQDYSASKKIIQDLGRIVNPKGIQENYELPIGGVQQWVFVRGQDTSNPIILFVHGGPASPMSPVAWMFQRPFEEYFTVIHYDQRASGKTYQANDTTGLAKTINIDQYVQDAIGLTELIKKRYHKKKVILIGHSWGTVV